MTARPMTARQEMAQCIRVFAVCETLSEKTGLTVPEACGAAASWMKKYSTEPTLDDLMGYVLAVRA